MTSARCSVDSGVGDRIWTRENLKSQVTHDPIIARIEIITWLKLLAAWRSVDRFS